MMLSSHTQKEKPLPAMFSCQKKKKQNIIYSNQTVSKYGLQ